MSLTRIGLVSSFPPVEGQSYPPTRRHPHWKVIYRLHDEWMMKYWPFDSEKKRARVPFLNLAGFTAWCSPAGDLYRSIWGARAIGVIFFTDDCLDTGKMFDRIPGCKKAVTGTGPLHPNDRVECCNDAVFRAVKATCHPRTFDQVVYLIHEWFDTHNHEPFIDVNQYLTARRLDSGLYFSNGKYLMVALWSLC
ncbi:hypothetical protein EW026_g5534 [Hermanssonia centrifuga]|uniref:Uncharacterized protein n=1 Tax=Hermanssonia centrifuga TaxID=98765 RepID=A0A4S4KE58_9APHY|nr:hypothetical protein EW026_g5534 [Hermanssonia centrifuga]